jgi:hypothetical protein
VSCRTFTVRDGYVDLEAYAQIECAHAVSGATASARTIELTPFDEDGTSGAYLLAVCPVGATDAQACFFVTPRRTPS